MCGDGMRRKAAYVAAFAAWIGLGTFGIASRASAQLGPPARSIVDTPTAGLLSRGMFDMRTRVYPGGGVDMRFEIAPASWISAGASYGGMKIIGDGRPDWYPKPGFFVKARVIEEDYVKPALAIGVDTQGAGHYDHEMERYQYKSRGLYAVASKNYAWYGDLTLHGGLSRSFEDADDRDITPFVGLEKSLGISWGLGLEYDFAWNDNQKDGAYGKGRGYLNGTIRWDVAPQMQVRFVVRDMLSNSETVHPSFSEVVVDEGWGREFSFSYVESF